MTDSRVLEFFQERKAAWLKKAINTSMSEMEVSEKELECEQVFSLEQWLPNAAKRAGQISISTHPCTFSHPSSRKNKNGYASSIIANSKRSEDGYLRSGNVTVEADALGNAAALDVYKFLALTMEDGQTLLSHIEQDSDLAQQLLNIKGESYNTLKDGFLAMVNSNADCVTSSKIKQVFFPVDNDYHQLSILSASGAMFELRKRIDTIRFSDETKAARACEKNNEIYDGDYKQVVNITTIGYGGTKPQNISVLNNQNGGKVHLLASEPPQLTKRDIRFPAVDFFSQSLSYFQCKDLFYALHELFVNHKNDWNIRRERDEYYQSIIDRIIDRMWLVRSVSKTQYNPDTTQLNKTQKIWLFAANEDKRETENDWLDELCKDIARFIFAGYEKLLGKKAFMFSDDEFKHIHKQVVKNKEALR
ncbi:MAG: type I-F CRISPR-associated protein Csy1 [Pseudohongiellaceae bacterium]